MSADTFTNWLTFTPATRVNYRRAYIDLPAFSYTGISSSSPSVQVAQFNFSASQNFILLNRPTKPTGVNYGLCIRYRVGETVYRYKLWQDTNFVLNDDGAPLYNGQLIKKNFVLEVWSLVGQTTAVQTTSIRMISSVRSVPTDITTYTDYALATGAEFTALSSDATPPSLPAGASFRWTNLATSAGLTDVISGAILGEIGPDIAAVQFVAADSTWLRGRAKFVASSNCLRVRLLGTTIANPSIYIVFNATPLDASLSRYLVALSSTTTTASFASAKLGNTDKVRCTGTSNYYDLTVPDTGPHIVRLSQQDLTVYGRLDEGAQQSVVSTLSSITSPYFSVGGIQNTTPFNEANIAEILVYNNNAIASGGATDLAILQYLRWYHFGEMPLPLTFDSGGAWLDNT